MKAKVVLVLLVLALAAIVLFDRLDFASGNTPRVVDAKYGVVAWPASPEFSIRSHSLVRTQYTQDWDGTGEVMKVSRVSREGLLIQHTTFTYKRGESRLRICDTRPAQLRFEVCGFVPLGFSPQLLSTPLRYRLDDLISITRKDHAEYFLLAVRKGERLLNGTEKESTLEFPGEPAYAML